MADANEHVQYLLPRYQLSPSVAAICYKKSLTWNVRVSGLSFLLTTSCRHDLSSQDISSSWAKSRFKSRIIKWILLSSVQTSFPRQSLDYFHLLPDGLLNIVHDLGHGVGGEAGVGALQGADHGIHPGQEGYDGDIWTAALTWRPPRSRA